MDTMYNYHALLVSIMTGCFPEVAFQKLESKQRICLSAQDYQDMLGLRADCGKSMHSVWDKRTDEVVVCIHCDGTFKNPYFRKEGKDADTGPIHRHS